MFCAKLLPAIHLALSMVVFQLFPHKRAFRQCIINLAGSGVRYMHNDLNMEVVMERYGMVIKVKSEKLAEYKELHAAVWPDVLDSRR